MFTAIKKTQNILTGEAYALIIQAFHPQRILSSVDYAKVRNIIRIANYKQIRKQNDKTNTKQDPAVYQANTDAFNAFLDSHLDFLSAVVQIKPALHFAIDHLLTVAKADGADYDTINFLKLMRKIVLREDARTGCGRAFRTIYENSERLSDLCEYHAPYIVTIIGSVASLWESKCDFVDDSVPLLAVLGLSVVE